MSPGRAELGPTAWLGSTGRGKAPAGGCKAEHAQGVCTRVGTRRGPCTPGPPVSTSSNARRLPPWAQRCLPGVLQDARLPMSHLSLRCWGLTWKMARPGLGGGRRGVMARLFSLDSHSWMVTILRAGGGRCRWVRRAFFRWWKSPSVSVYLQDSRVRRGSPGPPVPPLSPKLHLLPFSWVFLLWSKSAASLKETLRAVEELEDRNRSLSASR